MKTIISIIGAVAFATVAQGQSNLVLKVARSFSDGGGYNADWEGTGTPVEVRHSGQRVLSKGTNGTYCSGFTFAVVMKAASQRNLLTNQTVAAIKRFQGDWYGFSDRPASTREKQCVAAAVTLSIGSEVTLAEAQPGDFIQFWRNNESGHSAVFLGWEILNGRKVGIHYRSSQGATAGIGDHSEKIGTGSGQVNGMRIYLMRLK